MESDSLRVFMAVITLLVLVELGGSVVAPLCTRVGFLETPGRRLREWREWLHENMAGALAVSFGVWLVFTALYS